ncbi:hypothetical protein FNF27_01364 [Cafeteria roenbergensis]|uniref:Ras-related protein Rab-28 n=1 Tax=Cafeteria roenbergensis TaxID=33653 RepID=A0A5A8CAK6_CAFRO|nr:hypothetical protein FNF29_05841 [Cafeteria roenbergensis]KAA0163986.1 hypothetical protein FNF31_02535 [Cafeteria roenbergensis]KAA0172224.1 hypothetical protein FNF28_00227 [Cafeteria roenbergensis]KAA0177034.1 hypothetical protein FNF27_01364 [Cafeteria roenbergensis]|eukprot:KAA0149629.1 hypothetical protein FNF29_05841 [Cafeteria roenbergensis]
MAAAAATADATAAPAPEDSAPGSASSAEPLASVPTADAELMDESDEDSDDDHKQFKVILLGNGAVGKTSLARRFAQDEFGPEYKQTIGLDFLLKRLELPGKVSVTLQLWDIGGQSLTSKMISAYVAGAQAVVLCYDITSMESFEDLMRWYEVVEKAAAARAAKSGAAVPTLPKVFVLGNKTDISHMRCVKMARHQDLVGKVGGSGFLCSAKTGDQVNQAFFRIAAELAGVKLSRPDIQVQGKTITAHVINHKGDADEEPGEAEAPAKRKACAVM